MVKKINIFDKISAVLAFIVIPLALILAYILYYNVFGHPSNFEGGNPLNEPLKENYLGLIYKGGPVVILLISFQIILLTFAIERFINLIIARGKGNNTLFVQQIKKHLIEGEIEEAINDCDKNKGSVASVIKNGLTAYKHLLTDKSKEPGRKILELQRELEESTHLELPSLNRNMIIISTLASISTLIGLLGTVTGMIKAFSALARVGAPDAVGLAAGISQALITTALGISTAAIAIVFFNYFTSQIDKLTNHIDEASFSIIQALKLKS